MENGRKWNRQFTRPIFPASVINAVWKRDYLSPTEALIVKVNKPGLVHVNGAVEFTLMARVTFSTTMPREVISIRVTA